MQIFLLKMIHIPDPEISFKVLLSFGSSLSGDFLIQQ